MRRPYMAVVLVVLAGAFASPGQVGSSATQLVHPIFKDANRRNAPTSLNRDPSLAGDTTQSPSSNHSGTLPSSGQPAVVVAKIDSGLAASKLTMMGTMDGIR